MSKASLTRLTITLTNEQIISAQVMLMPKLKYPLRCTFETV